MAEDIEEALNIQQRQKRAMVMRRNEKKIERAKEIAKTKRANEKQLMKRAYSQARKILRRRFAGQQGANYEELGPTEKMAIDKRLDGKQALIKKIAMRLLPRVRQQEELRLQSFMQGKPLDNLGAKEGHSVKESLDEAFKKAITQEDGEAPPEVKEVKPKKKTDNTKNNNVVFYSNFTEDCGEMKSLKKKSSKSGIDIKILGEVYDRGIKAWQDADTHMSAEQYAFARVNSFINKGKSYYEEDYDLTDPSKREIGTDSLTDIYKKSTPNEKIKSLVKKVTEEVRTSDVHGEIVKGHKKVIKKEDGSEEIVNIPSHVRKAGTDRKIIKSGDVHDGKRS